MEPFCQIPSCENPAIREVFVSQERAGDSTRSLCTPCEEAYSVGVQHGSIVERETAASQLKEKDRIIARLQRRLRRIIRQAQFVEDDGAMELGERLLEIEKLAAAMLPKKGAKTS